MTMLRALVVAAILAVAATAMAPADASRAALQTSRAVVNVSGSNSVITFSGSIMGLAALQRVASVETLSYGGQGAAVCKINGVGNPTVQGQCLGEKSGKYWSYWRAAPGATKFSYSGSGAGGTSVSDGAVEGWNFGNGPPPFSSFCSVAGCAPPPPPPTPPPTAAAPAPTAAPTPTTPAVVATPDPGGGGAAAGSGGATGALPGQVGVGGASATGTGTSAGGAPGETSATASTSTSTTSGKDRARRAARQRRNQERAAGPINIQADDDNGTPWGVIAAGAGAVALGAGGFVIRSRRRSTPG